MNETITLYNHYNYGDIFLSRMIIKGLSTKFKINYYHKLKPNLFEDLDNVSEHPNNNLHNYNVSSTNFSGKIINTWIGQKSYKYLLNSEEDGCCFVNYWRMLTEVFNNMGIEIMEPESYLPTVNYQNLSDFDTISKKFHDIIDRYKKVILISNGDVLSQQSSNFDFTPIIKDLSQKHPDYIFLVTKSIKHDSENIVYTSDITNKDPDLLYISYFSTKSNVIIGRSSGPYVSSFVQENILDENKTFIAINNKKCEGYFYKKMKSKFVWTDNYKMKNIKSTIENNI